MKNKKHNTPSRYQGAEKNHHSLVQVPSTRILIIQHLKTHEQFFLKLGKNDAAMD